MAKLPGEWCVRTRGCGSILVADAKLIRSRHRIGLEGAPPCPSAALLSLTLLNVVFSPLVASFASLPKVQRWSANIVREALTTRKSRYHHGWNRPLANILRQIYL